MSISSNAQMEDDKNGSLERRRLDRFLELLQLGLGATGCTGDKPDALSVAVLDRRPMGFSGVEALRSLRMTSRRVNTSTDSINTRLRFLGEATEELLSEALLGES